MKVLFLTTVVSEQLRAFQKFNQKYFMFKVNEEQMYYNKLINKLII